MFWPFYTNKRTYLDFAAGMSANPSSPHEEGRAAKRMLEDARTTIARLVEVHTDDVIFTSGATEANALAILGVLRSKQKAGAGGSQKIHALYLPGAHASIVENMNIAATEGAEVEPLPIRDARIDIDALKKMLRPETALVSMETVCGETGVVWNTREVKQAIGPALLHVDASQAPLTQKITRSHFGADLLVFDASKVSVVRGIGALIAPYTLPLTPLYRGGGQERSLRPGSEAPELASAFAAALRAAALGREAFAARSEVLRAKLAASLATIPNIYINEGPKNIRSQSPHILNISLPGRDTDYLVALLDEAGFAISTRSACETDSIEGSRAVLALTGDPGRAKATLRISWGPDSIGADLQRFALALHDAVAFVDSHPLR